MLPPITKRKIKYRRRQCTSKHNTIRVCPRPHPPGSLSLKFEISYFACTKGGGGAWCWVGEVKQAFWSITTAFLWFLEGKINGWKTRVPAEVKKHSKWLNSRFSHHTHATCFGSPEIRARGRDHEMRERGTTFHCGIDSENQSLQIWNFIDTVEARKINHCNYYPGLQGNTKIEDTPLSGSTCSSLVTI